MFGFCNAAIRGELLVEDVGDGRGLFLDFKKALVGFLKGRGGISVSGFGLVGSVVLVEGALPNGIAREPRGDVGLICGLIPVTLAGTFQSMALK